MNFAKVVNSILKVMNFVLYYVHGGKYEVYRKTDLGCGLNFIPSSVVSQKIDSALYNSFGFGGHNACFAFRKVET